MPLCLSMKRNMLPDETPKTRTWLHTQPEQPPAPIETVCAPDDSLLETIGRYQVRRRLGGGGFGNVYLCFDDRAQREVAVKIPRRDRLNSADALDAFLREARNVARLDHPHIVPLYDIAEADGQYFLVYKFIAGCSLRQRMNEGPVPLAQVVNLIAEIAGTLHYAHGKNLFHRDIKPGNILLDEAGQPFVTDFGLAIPEEDLPRSRGRRSGTFPYAAPEQIRGEGHRVDGRTDIYSLGVVLYEMLCGRRPFTAADSELFEQILHQDVRPPRQVRDGIPREMERICLKAMSKQMSARYATALDLAEELRVAAISLAAAAPSAAESSHASAETAGEPHGKSESSHPSLSHPASPIMPKGLRSFGAEDQDFFLELLPGPRDRDGLPDALRFWKTRMESADPDQAFAVGLIYGPSGCGKSSLVKAGLLPRLTGIVPVYVEAAPQDTEARLNRALRKACPTMPGNLSLPELLARLRRGRDLPDDAKVLIVIDQFEQWLHAHGHDMESSDLLAALRHADGVHVQALLLVRDDFWMGTSRLFDLLEINLDRERNTRAVDLFDPVHAKRVLAMFGQAYERLPAQGSEWTDDQRAFLDRAVEQLSENGRIISVRLSLFADLMKDRPWTCASLVEVGGAEGVGLRFLEETFSARSALPDVRALEKPIRALLQALLPESGADIKGGLRSRHELAQACGLPESSPRFARLLDILDRELHIITPAELEHAAAEVTPATAPPAYYQLTHDYLVQPLRQWLTQERRKTWRGRAELCLEERTAQWSRARDRRFLPSVFQLIAIEIGVSHSLHNPQQVELLRAARRHYALRAIMIIALAVALLATWQAVQRQVRDNHARSLVARLLVAESTNVPGVLREMEPVSSDIHPLLAKLLVDESLSTKQRLRVRLALLSTESAQAGNLVQGLLEAEPSELPPIIDGLRRYGKESPIHADKNAMRLWLVLEDTRAPKGHRIRAACALASFDRDNDRWMKVRSDLASMLVVENPFLVSLWLEPLRPIRDHLMPPLKSRFLGPGPMAERSVAAQILASLTDDMPEFQLDLFFAGEDRQISPLLRSMRNHQPRLTGPIRDKLTESVPENSPEQQKEALAKAKANAAVALLAWDDADHVWPLLKSQSDPSIRTALIHQLPAGDVEPQLLIERLSEEMDSTVKAALILTLGKYAEDQLPRSLRGQVSREILQIFRSHPDAGVHSAADWLLRHWELRAEVSKAECELLAQKRTVDRQWFITPQQDTLARIRAGAHAALRKPDATEYAEEFMIGTKEVTVSQYLRSVKTGPGKLPAREYSPDVNCPVLGITFEQAMQYCLWRSRVEGLPSEQFCYEEDPATKTLVPKQGFLRKTGYRLPTETEWEVACGAEATTERFFGRSETYLANYGWFLDNSQGRAHPVGLLAPNDLGLFDVLGNAMEWCHGKNGPWRIRGGSFRSRPSELKLDFRTMTNDSKTGYYYVGFRVVRSVH